MEGLTVGTSASSFFGQYLQAKQKKKDPTEELKKITGVDLQIFDKKGKFLGLENAVKEFSKLKGKLSDEQMVGFGSQIAGEEGSAVFQAMVKNGDQFSAFNQEMTESASLQEKSAKNAENLTNKIEALTGSLSNLGAAGFGPLIAPLSKLTDKSNEFVGSLTEYAKAHPTLAGTTASVLSLGGAYLTLKAGSGVLSRLTSATALAGDTAVTTSKKVSGMGKNLLSLPNIVKIAVAIEMAGIAWDQFETLRKTVNQWKETQNNIDLGSQSLNKAYQSADAAGLQPDYKQRANDAMFALEGFGKTFSKALDPSRMTWTDSYAKLIGAIGGGEKLDFYTPGGGAERWKKMSPEQQQAEKIEYSRLTAEYTKQPVPKMFSDALDRATKEMSGAETIRRRAPMLENPNTMTAFRKDVLPGLNLSSEMNQHVQKMLERAFPDSYKQSNQQLLIEQAKLSDQSSQLGQSFTNLLPTTEGLNQGFTTTVESTNKAVIGMNNFANSANSLAMRVNGIEITPPTFSPIQVPVFGQNPYPSPTPMPTPLGRARGGSVKGGNLYEVGEIGRELFVPQTNGSIVSNDALRQRKQSGRATIHVNFSPTINIPSNTPNRAKLMADINRQLAIFKQQLVEEYSPDRLAQQVEFAAHRDDERT